MKKRNTGINYLPINDNIYIILSENGIIDMIKFPGVKCNLEEMKKFSKLLKMTGTISDIHGIPSFRPLLNEKNCDKLVDYSSFSKIIRNIKGNDRFSTHIGAKSLDGIDSDKYFESLVENKEHIKQSISSIIGKGVHIGGENEPGLYPNDFDSKVITPEFVSEGWGLLDFGVFDVAHAILAARELYGNGAKDFSDEYLLYKYIERLKNKDKVTTIHSSGLYPREIIKEEPDPHVMLTSQEVKLVSGALQYFPNAENIISEYVYSGKFGNQATAKEAAIEAITIANIYDLKKALEIKEYLEELLLPNASNLEECIRKIK